MSVKNNSKAMKQNVSRGQFTAQVNLADPPKSGFKYEYPSRGTGRLGRIYNTRVNKVYPGDTFEGKSVAALQFEPLAVPILANMHVKQEHYYVTFNSIWDDFDKFISGGEDMSYEGKMPSVSLRRMWDDFIDEFFLDGSEVLWEPIVFDMSAYALNPSGYELSVDKSFAQRLINFSLPLHLKSLLEQYQMVDLFDHIEPLVRQLGRYILSVIESGGNAQSPQDDYFVIYTRGYSPYTFASATNNVKPERIWSAENPNKYLAKMYKSVIAAYDNAANDGMEYFIPTSEGMVLLSYLYEIIKPFFGYGSNLDQMGYNKLTFDNFVYLSLLSLISSTKAGSELSDGADVSFNLDNFIPYLSDYPQEILSLRAQYLIWYENYRDQLLETSAFEPATGSVITVPEMIALLSPRYRCWIKDSMTTALTNAGTANAVVPLAAGAKADPISAVVSRKSILSNLGTSHDLKVDYNQLGYYSIELQGQPSLKIPTGYISGLSTQDDTQTSSSYFSLHMLDAAQRAQKWMRKGLFFGNRIQDFLWTHFAVKYLDARLRLPEILATSSKLVRLTDVINNTNVESENGTVAVAGDRAAIAHAFDEDGGYFKRFIEEHGVIISNLSVMPELSYANTFNKELAMLDQFDFPFPEFATLGMDAVYDVEMMQKSVKVSFDDSLFNERMQYIDPLVFGYQGRYYNAKSHLAEEHGELLDSQDMYTFARNFNIYDPDSHPKLNYIFVHCHPVLDMFVVDNQWSDYFRYDIWHGYDADRLLPVHSMYV